MKLQKTFIGLYLVGICIAGLCHASSDITLSGNYYNHADSESLELMGNLVCFKPDNASAKLLPPPAGNQDLWFCFNNTEAAKNAFNIPPAGNKAICEYHGEAKIRISNYSSSQMEGDADWNKADLKQVITKNPVESKYCD